MPARPAAHTRPRPASRRTGAPAARVHDHDSGRESAAARGYDADWRRLRKRQLQLEPLCRRCKADGLLTPATEVDHVVPIADAPGRRLDASNLQSLCHPCHSLKTAQETFRGAATLPTWVKPSRARLTIVCGPPGGGKTTYATEHGSSVVIDLDEIRAELTGRPWYASGPASLMPALRERNRRIAALATASKRTRAVLIVGAPTRQERRRWRELLKPERVVVLETPPDVCAARVRADRRRRKKADLYERLAAQWWSRYVRDEDDVVIEPGRAV